ncbi:MAG: ParB/RepB/Spo0J family partition protein [Chloroflexi bacterium]|nr:ParB/RepB/Spo0J family partition protein [Chloroflexota bacterium]
MERGVPGLRTPWSRFLGGKKEEQVKEVSIDQIRPNPYQPRKEFSDPKLDELSASILELGLVHPIVLRRSGTGYELVAGERRLRACKRAGLKTVPAVIRDYDERESALLSLIENLQREDLNPLEEAEGLQRLISDFNLTQKQLSEKVGKSQSTIANKLRLLSLPEEVKVVLADGTLTERHARALLKLGGTAQSQVLKRILMQQLNVRQTDELVSRTVTGQGDLGRPSQRLIRVFKDVRLFVNTVRGAAATLREAGIPVILEEHDHGDHLELKVILPKEKPEQERVGSSSKTGS